MKYKTFVRNKNILNHFILLCISSGLDNSFLQVLTSLLLFSISSMKKFEGISNKGLIRATEYFFSHRSLTYFYDHCLYLPEHQFLYTEILLKLQKKVMVKIYLYYLHYTKIWGLTGTCLYQIENSYQRQSQHLYYIGWCL